MNFDLAAQRVHELAERHHAALLKAEDELQEQRGLAGGMRVVHDVVLLGSVGGPGSSPWCSCLASFHRASISSSDASLARRPCSASRCSMWWKRSRNRCSAARSSRSGSILR